MKKIFLSLVLLGAITVADSQSVAINNDGSLPHPSAMLDVKNPNKGVLLPRTSTTTRNTIPAVKGLMVYDTTTSSFWFNNGSAWTELSGGTASGWAVNGTSIHTTATGNVGIGTTTPSYDLHIYRDNPSIGFYDVNDNVGSGTIVGDSADLIIAAFRKGIGATYDAGNLLLQVNTSFPTFTAGNVGIGTTAPNAKLHIGSNVMIGSGSPAAGYLLSVNGKIIAEEVRVELDSDWPDYVFKNDYRLKPLHEVEKFIKANKHLPNIPSAKNVKDEGVDLGDMNKRLLEKIEELTLYLIEQNKQLITLKKELEVVKANGNNSSTKQ